jgi:hypothetical protein
MVPLDVIMLENELLLCFKSTLWNTHTHSLSLSSFILHKNYIIDVLLKTDWIKLGWMNEDFGCFVNKEGIKTRECDFVWSSIPHQIGKTVVFFLCLVLYSFECWVSVFVSICKWTYQSHWREKEKVTNWLLTRLFPFNFLMYSICTSLCVSIHKNVHWSAYNSQW